MAPRRRAGRVKCACRQRFSPPARHDESGRGPAMGAVSLMVSSDQNLMRALGTIGWRVTTHTSPNWVAGSPIQPKNHSQLHKFFAKRRDILRGRIKSICQTNLAIISEDLVLPIAERRVNRGRRCQSRIEANTARSRDKEPPPPEVSKIRHVFGTTFSHVIRSRRLTRKLLGDQRPELTRFRHSGS